MGFLEFRSVVVKLGGCGFVLLSVVCLSFIVLERIFDHGYYNNANQRHRHGWLVVGDRNQGDDLQETYNQEVHIRGFLELIHQVKGQESDWRILRGSNLITRESTERILLVLGLKLVFGNLPKIRSGRVIDFSHLQNRVRI